MVTSSARSFYLAPVAALLAVLVSGSTGHAKCNPSSDPDKSDIANARAAVAANCACAGATSHGAYVSCAAQQANTVLVNKSCAGVVKKCASKSTCGRPGFVSCCRTDAADRTSCSIKSNAATCTAPKGGRACVGSFASCCDACTTGGCVTTTTATSTSTTTTTTTTTTTLPGPCGSSLFPQCGGECPANEMCIAEVDLTVPVDACVCEAQPACGGPYPACGGACPAGLTCVPVKDESQTPPLTACVCGTPGACPSSPILCPPPGLQCAAGEVCASGTFRGISFCGCTSP
jgi:hypothetical protein